MSLFKIFKGTEAELDQVVAIHEGYAYFCQDTGNFFIDTATERVQVNAYRADVLAGLDGEVYDIGELVLKGDIIDVEHGGTGANNAETARVNLDVYSKEEVDNEIKTATSVAYDYSIPVSQWSLNNETQVYSHKYNNTALTCGKAGNMPPVITYTGDCLEAYTKIDSAEATAEDGIVFYAKEAPEEVINLIIIDVK